MGRRVSLTILAFLMFASSGVSGDSESIPGSSATGVKVTGSVPFARESLEEVRTLAPNRRAPVSGIRAIPRHRIPRAPAAAIPDARLTANLAPAGPVRSAAPSPSAPALDNGFAGLGNPRHGQGDVIPPDTMGAAGPTHLVTLMNSDFGVFDKTTGAVQQQVSLQSFWDSLGTAPGDPAHFPFDPKILYDTHSGRFIAMTLGGQAAPDSWVMVAVSSTSDPRDPWYKWAIDADLDNGRQQFMNWADYPGLGVDAFNVYLATNMFSNSDEAQYGKVWVLPKPQLLRGDSVITWTEFRDPPGSGFSMQPAHTFGSNLAEYFLYEGGSGRLLRPWIDNTSGAPVWHSPTNIVSGVASFASSDFLPGAPQYGDPRTIDTSDTRILNVVHRNGSLWATHNVAVNGKVEVAWYRIDPNSNTVVTQGRISDPARWYYYPSLAVNQDDVAAIGFSGSSAAEYVGAYYTIVRPTSGVAEPASLLKSGAAPYYKTGQTIGIPGGGTANRWGDFSATVVDPADNVAFWTLQEYAQTADHVSGASRWGTWWGKFRPSDVAAPDGLTATNDNNTRVMLNWTDQSSNELGFKVERRRLPGQDYELIATVGPNFTSFTDNATTGLLAGFSYVYRVLAYDAAGGSYSAEAFATTAPQPPPPSSGGGGCLSTAGSPPEGDPLTGASSIGLLLLPGGLVYMRKMYLHRLGTRFRHPAC